MSTLAELQQIKTWVNAGKTLSGVTFVLTNNIDTGTTNIIIGKYTNSESADRAFAGVFDGNGHTIKNTISDGEISFEKQYNSLFPYVKGINAEIKNLTVAGTSSSTSIVGCLDEGAIVDHCISKTTINVKVSDGVTNAFAIGGIVGSLKNGKITNCINAGTIGNNSGTLYAGGIVGSIGGTNSLVENCINKGSLTVKTSGYLGGIAGIVSNNLTNAIIRNCKNIGNIKNDSTSETSPGGIAGFITSNTKINNNYNSGNVECSSGVSAGIVGVFWNTQSEMKYNCNVGSARYEIIAKFNGNIQTSNLDYVQNNYYLAHQSTSPSPLGISESKMRSFTETEAQTIVNILPNSGDYKGWKVNNSGLPELDLGELDNICNSL